MKTTKPKICLLIPRFAWTFEDHDSKPTKTERILPHLEPGDIVSEEEKKWKVVRIDERGIWAEATE